MLIYRDETNDLILSVTDAGYGYPVSTFLAEMGIALGGHKVVIEEAIANSLSGANDIHLLTDSEPLKPTAGEDDHPYIGLTLSEVIEKFCGAPEEI